MAQALHDDSSRLVYAVHLCRCLDEMGVQSGQPRPEWLEAVLYASRLRQSNGELASAYRAVVRRIPETNPAPDRSADAENVDALIRREAELDRRLWAAQASVLMPLVEQRRADFVNRYRSHFRLPFETELGVVERPEDLEPGQVVYYFERHDPPSMRAMREARWLRYFRNKLAHIEPLPPDQALHPILLG